MGLDGVELILEVEDTFGITIEEDDAPRIFTVGQLYEYILERHDFRDQPSEHSADLRTHVDLWRQLQTVRNCA